MLTGILAPMPEEIEMIIHEMIIEEIYEKGKRTFYKGLFAGKNCVVALSRIGKVASAVTAAIMIEHFNIDRLIVCGVAGALKTGIKTGDIIIATDCVQHDADCRPLFPQFEAPLLGVSFFNCDKNLIEIAHKSCLEFISTQLDTINEREKKFFYINNPNVYLGQLCSGDQFISLKNQLEKIKTDLPLSLCVEMEGGAVGQVCYEYNIPYVVIRTISDNANDDAHIDFNRYVSSVAKHYTHDIISNFIKNLDCV